MNKTNTKRFIKQFGFARDAYFKIREATRSYDILEICEINIRKSMLNEEIRVNLVVPSVNQEHVFELFVCFEQFVKSSRIYNFAFF